LAYCVLPTHWHFVLWPEQDGERTAFLRWLTHTPTQRWHAHDHTAGTGHLDQGRFRVFPIEADDHLYRVLRYVERNPLRAGRVARAEEWRWSSLARRQRPEEHLLPLLCPWPVPLPEAWTRHVQQPETDAELAAVRRCVVRNQPFGSALWQRQTAARLGLQYTFRPRGRPQKSPAPGHGAAN
jgi:putative transposase